MLRRIANKIRSALSIDDAPMERWSAPKLAEVKAYLEDKDPHIWSREDHYLAVEFIFQRYLPADEARTQAQYDATINSLKRKIDRNIDHPKEEIKEDSEFEALLSELLSTKIDREEILSLLGDSNCDDKRAQHKAASLFKHWMMPNGLFTFDEDMRPDMEGVVAKWDEKELVRRTRAIDERIYCDIVGMVDGEHISLSYAYHGIPDHELYDRLRYLAKIEVVTIDENDGKVSITSITKLGIDFFNQSIMDKFRD